MDKILKTLMEAVTGLVQEIKKIHEFLAKYEKGHNDTVDELGVLHSRINKLIQREEKLALMLEAVALKAGLTDGDLKELAESIDVEVREE
jgi:rubrerythrin